MRCNVCDQLLDEPIFDSGSLHALTSLCKVRDGPVRVWSCTACAHLLGAALPDTQHYYESDYRILLDDDEEDQIYETRGQELVYRTQHQVETLLSKLALPSGASMLDYGCAKASMSKALLARRPDLGVHLFDVSDMYRPYWDRFLSGDRYAVHRTPPEWRGRFDGVTSFFSLEHIPEPAEAARHVAELLKDDGFFYGIVPDTFGNVADFVVIDHVNHFTLPSLTLLLASTGFGDIDIDSASHRGALVFRARKRPQHRPIIDSAPTQRRSREIAQYWSTLGGRIRKAERSHGTRRAAIYGSGFYGAYIACTLEALEQVECFLDRSPFRQGKALFGKPIVAPEQIPIGIEALYIGLNPQIAKATIEPFLPRGVSAVYLDMAS